MAEHEIYYQPNMIAVKTEGRGKHVRINEAEELIVALPSNAASEGTLQDILSALGGSANHSFRMAQVGNYIYIGEAATGASESSNTWRLQRYDTTSGVVGLWAGGNANFDNAWDNHLTEVYS